MGNWRTVKLEGTCDARHVAALREVIDLSGRDYDNPDRSHRYGPWAFGGGICGLPLWAAEEINATGNVYERGFSLEDIRSHLDKLAFVAPSLKLKVHCGGDYEDKKCIATIVCAPQLNTHIAKPEIETIPEIDEQQMEHNLMTQLRRQGL